MKKQVTSTIFSVILFLIITTPVFSQETHQIDLNGSWKFRKAGTKQWLDAKVPGTVHTDLMANKLIQDPFFGNNEKDLQWISDIGWEYMKTFNISDTLFRNRHIELVCQGLDTYANVYLNDSLVIVADNMFREWYADIRYLLKIGSNTLRIQFPSVTVENKSRYDALPNKLPGDEKVVCRKAGYHFGWDWGPTLITSGIWKPVFIRTWNFTNTLGVQYIQRSLTDSVAELTGVFTVLTNLADTTEIRIYDGKNLLASQFAGMKKGVNTVRVNFSIKNPQRWWSNGLGEAHLYALKHEIYFAGRFESSAITKIGLRTLEMVQNNDTIGISFFFKLNGKPVFMKGANYIPQDVFLPRVKDSSYRAIIRSAAEANMNMLRVWGGGIYEKDIFYDLCDEYGIIVWQDFMFANAMYPGTKEFVKNVQAEAVQNIVRLRNHACLGIWCGNNEIDEGWKNWGWQKQYGYTKEDSTNVWRNYRRIFREMIPAAISKFDSLRPYIFSSPGIGWGFPLSMTYFDSHYWGIWWGNEPFSKYREKTGRFMSEYGFQGFPPMESIRKFTSPEDRQLQSTVMKAHQKHPTGYQIIDEYMLRDYQKPKDFESYGYVSMLLQSEGMKIAIEAHRRAMPVCMGSLYWQLNDCWPVVSWSSQDYYGNKKAFHFNVKKEYATVLVSPLAEKDRIDVFVISDSLKPIRGMMNITVSDFNGKKSFDTTFSMLVSANSSKTYATYKQYLLVPAKDTTKVFLTATFSAGSKVLSRNILYFTAPKNLGLDAPVILKTIKPVTGGYSITLDSKNLAKDVYLIAPVKGEFSDNFFDLLPGETKTVFYKTPSKNPGFSEKLKIRTLRDTY